MKFTSVLINNYRSIKNVRIAIDHGCQALIGINESGKSNILKAIKLIDPEAAVTTSDLRLERRDEEEVSEGSVQFSFSLNREEITLLNKVNSIFFHDQLWNTPLAKHKDKILTLRQFCELHCFGLYEIKIPTGERQSNYWALIENDFEIEPGWFYNPQSVPCAVTEGDAPPISVPALGYGHFSKSSSINSLEPASLVKIHQLVGLQVRSMINEKLPKCVFWRYSDEYLLPSSIAIENFIASPQSCIPLKSMFELAGYDSTTAGPAITKARAQSQHRYMQLLDRVSDAATRHIREVWKDHGTIRVHLRPNGELLVPIITDDEVPMDMASRSDGFKRFVSFLLQVSVKVRSEELKDSIILFDEPEIGLHPGGAKNLMNELIEISGKNTVFYSTHSIFMVDPSNVSRHLIIKKLNESTQIERAERSKIQDEQVLFAAMGYSIFETLKSKNLIFEGWRDKEIFRVLTSKSNSQNGMKDLQGTIGLTFAEGVKDIKNIARLLELANRGCLIISDADTAAHERRREYTKLHSWGKWVTLAEIYKERGSSRKVVTGEDLIKRPAILKRANKWRSSVKDLAAIEISSLEAPGSVLRNLHNWVRTSATPEKEMDLTMDSLKTALFSNLSFADLEDDAIFLVEYVQNHEFATTPG